MDAVAAFTNYVVKLGQSKLTTVIRFARTTSDESAIVNGEYQGVEKLLVSSIERDVDEYAYVPRGHSEKLARSPVGLACRGLLG
jgi:hypothetical protein